jgi:hypothetical protein
MKIPFPSTSLRSSEGKSFSFSFPLSTYTQTLMAGDVQALACPLIKQRRGINYLEKTIGR